MKNNKHYLAATLIIAGSFLVLPFSTVLIQQSLGEPLAKAFLGDLANGDQQGQTNVIGKEIGIDSNQDLRIKGSASAEIFLVEYSDLECPFCKSFHSSAEKVVAESNGKVAWIYKHFPLEFHPNAKPAAIAAECIAKSKGTNAYWNFIDGVFTDKIKLTDADYLKNAGMQGMTAQEFNTCIKDPTIAAIVEQNQTEGASLGVSGTPNTFIVKKTETGFEILETINGAQPYEAVQALVEKHLTK